MRFVAGEENVMKLEKKPLAVPDIVDMPKPTPARAGARKAVVLALLAILLVGGAAFWLTRDKSTRDKWREQAAEAIDNAASGTPLAGAGNVLRDAPPPPPVSVVSPPTAPGTLAGQTVQGSVGAPVDGSIPVGQYAGSGEPVPQKVTEDSHVRLEFVEDLAAFLVSRFRPGPGSGVLNVSVQSLNQRYGVRLAGVGGRGALLRYAFHPTMLRGLYGLYADRFLDAVNREASARRFTPEQTRQLHMALAGRMVILAGALEGVAAVPNLEGHLRELDKASQTVVDINAQMSEAVFAVDQMRENNVSGTQLSTAQLRVEGLSARYRRALEERANQQRSMASAIRRGGGQALDDDSLLFLAQWVHRRLRADPQALDSVRASAGILRDLARRSAQAATATPFQPHNAATPGMTPAAPASPPAMRQGGLHLQAPAAKAPASTVPSMPPAKAPGAAAVPQAMPAAGQR